MLKIVCTVLLFAAFCSADIVEPSEGEFNGELFEGDLILPPSLSRAGRKANRWPGGIFYYRLTSGITSQSKAVTAIRAAMQEWEAKTCIQFRERTNEPAFVEFVTGRGGCWSNGVGRNGNKMQTINLDPGCWGKGTVVHEIGHALGFWHEQSRPDRDAYINIHWENIKKDRESQFTKIAASNIDNENSPYDFASIMHYPKWAFQKSRGLDTISVKPQHGNPEIGQRNGLSAEDAKQMNSMYSKECRSQPGNCQDTLQSCSGWTRYCSSNDYVKKNCKKTCRLCGGIGPSCSDKSSRCSGWTRICRSNQYVKDNCKKTCKLC